jgi:glycosyltransferase involved in cell wall biosynthesis
MKIAFVYPPMLVGGRPLDFSAIETSPRGTTGSETQILSMAREMAARGHHVELYIENPNAPFMGGVVLRPLHELQTNGRFDATCVSLDVNACRDLNPEIKGLRVVFQQLNDFNYAAGPDFADFVDLFVSPSEPHREHLEHNWPTTRGKWAVVPNGCRVDAWDDFSADDNMRVPGRVIYPSSPDRGLHLLLQEWPAIKKAVPHAHLKIFYYSLQNWIDQYKAFTKEDPTWHPFWKENYRRALYISKALPLLKPFGVEVVGSVSREQMAVEMAQAEVLAYPCDPIAWTEGFSCATLEGCASGALPVISSVDALGGIYRGICPMAAAPVRANIAAWREMVIRALTDKPWADEWRARGREFAKAHDWALLAERFEKLLQEKVS